MEVSNSEVLFSQENDLNSVEFDFVVTPSLHDREEDEIPSSPNSYDECKLLISSTLKELKNIHNEEEEAQQEVNDGFKTPTSLQNKIPALLKCPPAPKKPKSLPLSKRKCAARRRVLLDLSNEIDSLFPPHVVKDLIGGKIKKMREEFGRILT